MCLHRKGQVSCFSGSWKTCGRLWLGFGLCAAGLHCCTQGDMDGLSFQAPHTSAQPSADRGEMTAPVSCRHKQGQEPEARTSLTQLLRKECMKGSLVESPGLALHLCSLTSWSWRREGLWWFGLLRLLGTEGGCHRSASCSCSTRAGVSLSASVNTNWMSCN